MIVRTAHKNK